MYKKFHSLGGGGGGGVNQDDGEGGGELGPLGEAIWMHLRP